MQHQHLNQIRNLADVQPVVPPALASPRERINRWIEVLERNPDRQLSTLEAIEWTAKADRPFIRSDDSPLTVAFTDPVLRADGLTSDRLGDALTFFEMTEDDAHYVMCSCIHGRTMTAGCAAARLRGLPTRRTSWIAILLISMAAFGGTALLSLLG